MSIGADIAGVTILAVLPAVFLAARFAAKRTKGSTWSLDDTLLVLALIFLYIIVAAFITSMAVGHVGQHMRTATLAELERTLFILWFFRSPMAIELALTRCAISIFFLQILYTKAFPWLRRSAYLCITLSIASALVTIVGMLLHCRPLPHNWELPIQSGHFCFNIEPFMITIAAVGVGLDVVTWLTPHYVVWGLQLRLAHKLAITMIFAFGILTIIIGAFRINGIGDVSFDGDLTYGIGTNLLWALAQMSTGIVVACLPHLRPAFEKVLPSRFTRISTRRRTNTRVNTQNEQSHGIPRTPRQNSISVTTKIEIGNGMPSPKPSAPFHDGHQEPWAPTFKVAGPLTMPQQHTVLCREGPPRAVGCCCLRL